MKKIFLDQKTLRLLFLPANTIIMVIIWITTCIPFNKIPTDPYADFVFYLFKPMLLIEIVLSTCVLVIGYTGATRYNQCWQASYTFFLFLLCIIGIFTIVFCDGLHNSLETVIPNLLSEGQYTSEISEVFSSLSCSQWDDTETIVGCHTKLVNALGNYPEWARPYMIAALVFLIIYTLINLFVTIFVSLQEESANHIEVE